VAVADPSVANTGGRTEAFSTAKARESRGFALRLARDTLADGIAMGWSDDSLPANAVVSQRRSIDSVAVLVGFDD